MKGGRETLMKRQNDSESSQSRMNIIKTVQTPLGFFVLIVLVVEGILGIVAGLGEGADRTLAIRGMLAIIAVLILAVFCLAWRKPGNLMGLRASLEADGGLATHSGTNRSTIGTAPDKNSSKIVGTYLAEWRRTDPIVFTYVAQDLYRANHPDWEGFGRFDGKYYCGFYAYKDTAPPDIRGQLGVHIAGRRALDGGFDVYVIELGFTDDDIKHEDFKSRYEYNWPRLENSE